MTFATSVAKYLESLNYGKVGKDIFINNIPLTNSNKALNIAVYDTPSYAIVGRHSTPAGTRKCSKLR